MVNNIQYDQTILSDETCKYFRKKLCKRINDIEETIDVHLHLIDGLDKYMDRSYLYKLAVLEANEDKVS